MYTKTLVGAALAASMFALAPGASAEQCVVGTADLDRDGDGVRNRRDAYPRNPRRG